METTKFEPTERDQLIHRWKVLTCKGDIGAAGLIKKQLEKDKPQTEESQDIEKQTVTEQPKITGAIEKPEPPIKKKRGRPRKI